MARRQLRRRASSRSPHDVVGRAVLLCEADSELRLPHASQAVKHASRSFRQPVGHRHHRIGLTNGHRVQSSRQLEDRLPRTRQADTGLTSAARLGRAPSTVAREVAGNGGRSSSPPTATCRPRRPTCCGASAATKKRSRPTAPPSPSPTTPPNAPSWPSGWGDTQGADDRGLARKAPIIGEGETTVRAVPDPGRRPRR